MIEIDHLSKTFGPITAVDDVSFTVAKGEVLGFLGPNGAGKSTTMKMITGFLPPTPDGARLPATTSARAARGQAPGSATCPRARRLRRHDTAGVPRLHCRCPRPGRRRSANARIATASGQLQLAEVLRQPIETLSKGFKRRVGLAQAMLHDPEVLILDEPTDGLDPNQKHEVRELIRSMARKQGDRHLDAHPRRGRGGVHAAPSSSRTARIVADEHAGRASPPARRATTPFRCTIRGAGTARGGASAWLSLAACGGDRRAKARAACSCSRRSRRDPIMAQVSMRRAAASTLEEAVTVERGRLDEVFREHHEPAGDRCHSMRDIVFRRELAGYFATPRRLCLHRHLPRADRRRDLLRGQLLRRGTRPISSPFFTFHPGSTCS